MNLNPTGCGLGLAISNVLSKLLGPLGLEGVKVDSVKNEFSKFSFII
jgi:hypothetical protein